MEPIIQVKEKAVEHSEVDFSYGNNPFNCNAFDSNNSVETTENQEDYIVNVPLFGKATRKKVINALLEVNFLIC